MFRKLTPEQFISISSQICQTYSVSISEVNMPEVNALGCALQIVKMRIQHKWLENITRSRWEEDQFREFNARVCTWVHNSVDVCPRGQDYDIWFTITWKRGAELLLGITQAQ